MRVTTFFVFVTFALSLFAIACSSPPAPPTLTPKQATVTGVSMQGIDLLLEVDAYNPNAIALSARSVTGHAKLDGKYDLGNVTVTTPTELPAKATVTISTPLSIKWSDASMLASMGMTNRPIPYEVTGTVNVGGEKLNVDVPFTLRGAIKHDDIVTATMRSLPAIPGIPLAVPR
jgi:LEA14-like dessication related protein